MLPLLLLRIFREAKDAYRPQMELQVIGACSDELAEPPIEVERGISRSFEPSTRCARRLSIGSAAACVACMVLCTAVFLFLHVIAPGQSLESLSGQAKAQVCDSCFCENVSPDVGVVYDLKYGSAYSERHGQEVDLLLDVHRPTVAPSSKAPAVLLIHGGNFIGGSKQAGIMEAEALYFARAGFVVFNMNYRLEGSTYLVELSAVRDAVHDAKAAVRFIVDQAESFGVDPTRIAAWGESAGGITAISMNSVSSEGSSGNPGLSSNISAAVSLSGTMWPFLVASPRNEVLRDTPWFNVHSKGDSVVYPFLAVMTHVYLLAKGVPDVENRLLWVAGAQHVPWSSSVSATVRPVVLNFLSDVMDLKAILFSFSESRPCSNCERHGTTEMENFSTNQFPRPRSISMTSEESRELIDKDQMRKALEQQGFLHLDGCNGFHQLWEAIGNEVGSTMKRSTLPEP
eukprot:s3168_g7.t1